MIDFLLNQIVLHSGEIGTFLVTALVGLLKRFLDKGKIRTRLLSKGLTEADIKNIV